MGKFEELYALNVNDKTEKKGQLTYLSWAWAWAEFKKAYPDAKYTVNQFDGTFCTGNEKLGWMVHTTVTAGENTHEMWLPIMDGRNNTILQPKMTEVNKTIMRCLTKNLAMFGLGLYIYAGEDLPENEEQEHQEPAKPKAVKQQPLPTAQPTRETQKTALKSNDKKQSDGELTMTELVSVWGVKNPEETMLWLEKRLGVFRDEWTIEEHKLARDFVKIGYEKRKAEAAKMRQALQNAGGEVPFEDVE